MTPQITAALQILDQCQQEMEADAALLHEVAFMPGATAAIKAGLKIRLWLHKANIKALEQMIIAELENRPLHPNLIEQ
jgi:hypothetical protein